MRNKKVLSFALVLALTVSLFPAAAFASDNTEAAAAAVEETAE